MQITAQQKLHLYYLLGITIFHGIVGSFLLAADDEMYYWVWSKKLAWGYFDHPPMVALMVFISSILAKGFLGIRLLTILSCVATLVIWKAILKPNNKADIHIFYWCYLSFAAFQIFGIITTPDVPLLLFGSLYLLYLKRIIESNQITNYIVLGLTMALVMYSKYMGALLIVFSLVPLFFLLYKNWKWYFSLTLSLFLYIPALIWKSQHDWVSVDYHLFDRVRQDYFSWFNVLNYLLGFLILSNIVIFTIPFQKWKSITKTPFHLSLMSIAAGTFIFFFISSFSRHTQSQWNLIIYMALFGLSFPILKEFGKNNWRFSMMVSMSILMMLGALVLSFAHIPTPMSKIKNFVESVPKISTHLPVFERYQQTAAYQYYQRDTAYCYRVYNHRKSQYDLWEDEEKMQQKNLTFFGLEKLSDDSIIDNYNKWEFIKDIQRFRSFPKVDFFDIKPEFSGDNNVLDIDLQYFNPYSTINLKSEKQSVIIIGFNREGHPIWTRAFTENAILNQGRHSLKIQFSDFTLSSEIKKLGIGLQPNGVSGKLQSDYFDLNRD